MIDSTKRALLIMFSAIGALIFVPTMLVLFHEFINAFFAITLFIICVCLVCYYTFIDIREELLWEQNMHEQITYGFRHDKEKMRYYKFFVDYFDGKIK